MIQVLDDGEGPSGMQVAIDITNPHNRPAQPTRTPNLLFNPNRG